MEWIRITDPEGVEVGGDHVAEGQRTHTSYHSAKRLVLASRAEYTDPPDHSEDTTSVDSVDWASIDGIGEESAADIEAWLDQENIHTVADLLAYDLTRLPHVGQATADRIRSVV
jgi:DNA uptake protein ComE-like DNA-binding protein